MHIVTTTEKDPTDPFDGHGERLGTISEAREKLGLRDTAAVWDKIAHDDLRTTRESNFATWTVWKLREH